LRRAPKEHSSPGSAAAQATGDALWLTGGEGRSTPMKKSELVQATDPQSLVEGVRRYQPPQHMHHGGPMETVRETTYRGHRIVVRTSYEMQVDGVTIDGHMGVTNDGQVHYHPVPNLSFGSAVDLVKNLIDVFPDDFTAQSSAHSHGQEA
jgi:hypothetical protein